MASDLCCSFSYCLRRGATVAVCIVLGLSLPFLALPVFALLFFLLLSCLSGLGFLFCLRYVLRLWNPRIEAIVREQAVSRLEVEVRRANAGQNKEDGCLWDEGWLPWARAGVEGLRQLRVHQYLEDQLKNLGVLEGATDRLVLCGWEESMSLDDESLCAQEIISKGVASSFDEEDDDDDRRSGSKHRHLFCMK